MSDNEQRDELASVITDHVHEGLLSYDACTPHAEIAAAADAILAAGYRKSRAITTAKELDALPEGSVILTNGGEDSAQKDGDGEWYLWGGNYGLDSDEVYLPATVIHEPTTEATQ